MYKYTPFVPLHLFLLLVFVVWRVSCENISLFYFGVTDSGKFHGIKIVGRVRYDTIKLKTIKKGESGVIRVLQTVCLHILYEIKRVVPTS